MQFIRTLFWVAIAVGFLLFSITNWTVVTINLWGGLQADVKLPVLLLGAFLLGFLPTLIVYAARNWSLRRRLETQGGVVANMPPVRNAPAPPDPKPRTNA
ncbi:MAG: lipopolysaccharide assembly protein LapA domain-containing protein [Sphingomonas sp.]